MLKRQEHAVDQVIKLRASIDETRRRVDLSVYQAVRVQGVPVQVMAERLGLTRARVYQMVNNGAAQVDG
jgi:predicted transcriptional regulator